MSQFEITDFKAKALRFIITPFILEIVTFYFVAELKAWTQAADSLPLDGVI